MRPSRLLIILIPVLAIQIGFLPALRPFGVVPNLVLGLVVLVGLAGTATNALLVALAGGVLLDLTSGSDFGLRIGLLVLVALAAGLLHRSGFDQSGAMVVLALTAAGTVLEAGAVLAGVAGFAGAWPIGILLWQLLILVVLNLGLTMILRPLVNWAAFETAAVEVG